MSLRLESIGKKVGRETHIDAVSLEFEAGSRNVLLGRTLSGKTSLLRLMAGLDRPTCGRVMVNGQDVTGKSVRKRSIAMVYQQFINYPSLSVFDNIASPLKIAKIPKLEIYKRVRTTAEMLHLEGFLDRIPSELSGGQQQRVAIARALIHNPSVVLADEPTASLDTERAYQVVETFAALIHENNRAGIMVTHDLRMCQHVDRILQMRDGKLVAIYETREEILRLAKGE